MDYGVHDTSPDFLGDARSIPIRTGSADIVFFISSDRACTASGPDDTRMCRVLRPGWPSDRHRTVLLASSREPNDFYRFTKYGFCPATQRCGFSEWEITEDGGDWAQLALAFNLRLNSRVTVHSDAWPICWGLPWMKSTNPENLRAITRF